MNYLCGPSPESTSFGISSPLHLEIFIENEYFASNINYHINQDMSTIVSSYVSMSLLLTNHLLDRLFLNIENVTYLLFAAHKFFLVVYFHEPIRPLVYDDAPKFIIGFLR